MLERYSIKFGPAVSQKELEKALHEPGIEGEVAVSKQLHKMKARIEVIGDFADLKKINDFMAVLSSNLDNAI